MPPEDRHSGLPGGGGGANVKSGVIAAATDGDSGGVTFNTAFGSAPRVTMTLEHSSTQAVDNPKLNGAPSTTGFSWRLMKGHGGSAHTWDIHWIATDAGDP